MTDPERPRPAQSNAMQLLEAAMYNTAMPPELDTSPPPPIPRKPPPQPRVVRSAAAAAQPKAPREKAAREKAPRERAPKAREKAARGERARERAGSPSSAETSSEVNNIEVSPRLLILAEAVRSYENQQGNAERELLWGPDARARDAETAPAPEAAPARGGARRRREPAAAVPRGRGASRERPLSISASPDVGAPPTPMIGGVAISSMRPPDETRGDDRSPSPPITVPVDQSMRVGESARAAMAVDGGPRAGSGGPRSLGGVHLRPYNPNEQLSPLLGGCDLGDDLARSRR